MQLRAMMHVYRLYRRFFNTVIVSGVMALVLTLSLLIVPAAGAINIGGPSDCDSNAIINCGAHSTGALMSAYNSSAYVRAVYAYFGISQADMAGLASTNVAGRVTKDGNVFVDGQSRAVASNAVTGGRQNIAGSTVVNFQGVTFYQRPPSVSFQQSSLPAFVSMKNGSFQFAVIASCGNAVRANAIAAPAPPQHAAVAPARVVSRPSPPKPAAPAPAPSQAQAQSQQVNVNNTNTNTQTQTVAAAPEQPQEVAAAPAQAPAAQSAAPQTTPAANLPNTGPTGVAGAFLASMGLGIIGYRRFVLHKLLG